MSLQKLLQREEIITDEAGAAGELRGALVKLATTVAAQRLEALEEKSRRTRLEPQELKEFQELQSGLRRRKARADEARSRRNLNLAFTPCQIQLPALLWRPLSWPLPGQHIGEMLAHRRHR